MKPWSEMSGGAKAGIAGGGAVVAAVIAAVVYWFTGQMPATDTPVAEPAAVAAVPAAEPAPAPEPVAPPPPEPPVFDLVRVTQDGSAIVAGHGALDALMSIQIDGEGISQVPTDGQGAFVAMFNLPPSTEARTLSLIMRLADGTEIAAKDTVVIAPTVAPDMAAGEAEQAPAALLITDLGAKVLQDAEKLAPELVSNITIDTITYSESGAVQLAGRGTAEAAVRIYLDNAQIADTKIGKDGAWAITLPEIAPGIYTLRADQLDDAGKVTSRFETPFKRETIAALAEASGVEAPAAEEPAAEAAAEPAAEATAEAAVEPAAEPVAEATAEPATETAATTETAPAVEPAPAPEPEPEPAKPVSITVQPGYSLWRIASENLGDGVRYVQVFEANKDQIRDPDLIYPGQVFAIPTP